MATQYAIELNYLVTIGTRSLAHNQRFRVNLADPANEPAIGEEPANISLETNGLGGAGGTTTLDNFVDEYLTFFCGLFGAQMTVASVVLTKYPNGFDRSSIYVSPIDLTDATIGYETVGRDPVACEPAQQLIFTFFDSRGRISKLTAMETATTIQSQQTRSQADAKFVNYADYVIGINSAVRGSGNSKLLSSSLFNHGKNEAVWRLRNR